MRNALPIFALIALLLSTCCFVAQAGQGAKASGATTGNGTQDKDFRAQRNILTKQAKAVFDREMAREKAGDCPDARTTYDEVHCLGKAGEITDANYKAYAEALRSLLALRTSGAETVSGPTGMPLSGEESVKEFDQVEELWEKYRKAQTSAAFDSYRGGTIAPVMAAACDLQLVRNHMRELDAIYGTGTR